MNTNIFNFDPAQYSETFAREGYVHIHHGVTEEFFAKMAEQVDENIRARTMKEFAVGDKQQAMYEFPDDGKDYVQDLLGTVGKVCSLKPDALVLSERHIKAYEADADSEPLAHKDRYASQISVGISVHVQNGSTLVLYPYEMCEVNPFNSSTRLRASLSLDQYPEPALRHARRVEIHDSPRDVIIFRGHSIWHLRANPALTTMLYLKLNAFNCDPLGEDPRTEEYRRQTQMAISMEDSELIGIAPLIGRRVDYIHRYYTRDWDEVVGVVLWGDKHFTIDEQELALLRAMNGKRTLGAILTDLNYGAQADALRRIRRLAEGGAIDLVKNGHVYPAI
jgi:hypothetical protein